MRASRRLGLGFVGLILLACAGVPGDGDAVSGEPPAAPTPGAPTPGAPTPGASAGSGALPADALRLKRITVVDRQGYDQPVPAFSFLVPHDWNAEGGVEWTGTPHCPENVARPWARAESPDGRLGFEVFPPVTYTWDTDPQTQQLRRQAEAMGAQGCPYMPPMSAADFVRTQVIPAHRAGARVVAAEPMPAVASHLDRAWSRGVQAMRSQGAQARYQVDAARVRLVRDGREEWISAATATLSTMVMPGMSTAEVQTTQAAWMFAVRAPEGRLAEHEELLGTIVASYRVAPRWQAAISRFSTGIRQAQIRSVQEIGRIYRETNEEIMASRHESWKASQATSDEVARSFSQAIRDVDEWRDPSGPDVELDAGWDFAWSNGQGEYIATGDANWNPNVALGESGWEQLERVR